MVTTNTISTKQGKTIKIKAALNCRNHGIYAAKCKKCLNFYVGQTKNSFATRWSSHRHCWNKVITSRKSGSVSFKDERDKEQNALFLHYWKHHRPAAADRLPKISEANDVIFVESPKQKDLDIR